MKKEFVKEMIIVFGCLFFIQLFFCKDICAKEKLEKIEKVRREVIKIKIEVDDKKFAGVLENNAAVSALVKNFPMSANMSDLNANEKYFYLDEDLPRSSQEIPKILAGDIVLFGSNCLVLFYKSIANSYRYTKIGRIENVSGLVKALGKNSVKIKWSLENVKNSESNINTKNGALEYFSENIRSIDASKKVKKMSKRIVVK